MLNVILQIWWSTLGVSAGYVFWFTSGLSCITLDYCLQNGASRSLLNICDACYRWQRKSTCFWAALGLLWPSIGCFMSYPDRLVLFYLCCCCHGRSSACRIGSRLSQSDLTFECRSGLHRWPSCLFTPESAQVWMWRSQIGHAVRAGKETSIQARVLPAPLEQRLLHYWPYLFVLVEKLFLLRSCVCSL